MKGNIISIEYYLLCLSCWRVKTRELTYSVTDKLDGGKRPVNQVVIQDHSYGHSYANEIGNQPFHFNVRPITNTQTGTVSGTKKHYYFSYRNKK